MAPTAKARMRAVISPETCADGHAIQTGRLSTLPAELTLMIWQNLDRDTDKTCFALTCKANAQFYNRLGKASSRPQTTSPEQKVNLLQRLRDFSTLKRYRICFKCGKYKPVRGFWGGDSKYGRLRIVSRAQRIKGPNCPQCFHAAKQEMDKFRKQR